MFVPLVLALAAAPAPASAPPAPMVVMTMPGAREISVMREPRQAGVTPYENRTLSMPHRNSDDRMFPDIAIGALQIDGDTLYVKVINKGRGPVQVPIMVAARAEANGVRSEALQARTGKLAGGESRWVPLRGFSFKAASTNAPVFELASAKLVSAVVHLVPSSASVLDRSGQGCGECTREMDEANNSLTASGDALKHGKPQ